MPRKRKKLEQAIHNHARHEMGYKQISSPVRLAIRAPEKMPLCSCVGLCHHVVVAVRSEKTTSDEKSMTPSGWQVRSTKLVISKLGSRIDRTSCFYTPGVVRNTHAQEAYLWAKKETK